MPPTTLLHDSPLGRWLHTEWAPSGLRGVVERIWHFDGLTTHRHERAFPNGLCELIVQLGGRYREARGVDRLAFDPCPTLCLSGLQTGPTVIESPAVAGPILGIRLTPIGTYLVLGHASHPILDRTVDLGDLCGSAASELMDEVAGASDPGERVRRAGRWVERRVAQARRPDSGVLAAAGALEASHGRAPIAAIRDRLGWTKTRLVSAFRDQIGIAPKHYARVLRFRHAINLLAQGPSSLTRLALEAGYYDQPHLNAEFREMAGMAPTAFLRATKYENSVSLAG